MNNPFVTPAMEELWNRHFNELLDTLESLLEVPELRGCDPDDLSRFTRGVLADARALRNAIHDDLSAMQAAP